MAFADLLLALALGAAPAATAPDAAVLSGVLEVHERTGGCGGEAGCCARMRAGREGAGL